MVSRSWALVWCVLTQIWLYDLVLVYTEQQCNQYDCAGGSSLFGVIFGCLDIAGYWCYAALTGDEEYEYSSEVESSQSSGLILCCDHVDVHCGESYDQAKLDDGSDGQSFMEHGVEDGVKAAGDEEWHGLWSGFEERLVKIEEDREMRKIKI